MTTKQINAVRSAVKFLTTLCSDNVLLCANILTDEANVLEGSDNAQEIIKSLRDVKDFIDKLLKDIENGKN